MAGRIRSSDIEEVKARTNIVDVVSDHVALKSAGVDSLKGLCPFHDERSPSFHVRPSNGYYHCFGCGESGDAISFLQRMDHLTFTESVERLAARIGYVLTYEEGSKPRESGESRARLIAANAAAAEFYRSQLAGAEAETARQFLQQRSFDSAAAEQFGIGYAPKGWDALTKHLTAKGFTKAELTAAGLASQGDKGIYDRFRGRLLWPIRDTSGQTIGFGARKLYEDDQGPKYLNTPETPIYHKSNVLYGLDLAKKSISRSKSVVVVEGYTDVMACHLAGITTAVATCGTAFGHDHISVLRRVMGDDAAGEVIFTFDPDEAGQKAALRAFSDEKRFTAQTFVAEAPDGLDPCDLRLRKGDEAVRAIFARKIPLFEFALRQAISKFDSNTVEGRVNALRAAAPIVADIKDPSLRPGYARELARMLGLEMAEVHAAIRSASNRASNARSSHANEAVFAEPANHQVAPEQRNASLATLPNNPSTWLERDALMAMLQLPHVIDPEILSQASTAHVADPSLVVVRDAISANLPLEEQSDWLQHIFDTVPAPYLELTRELSIAPLPAKTAEAANTYAREVVTSLLERDLLGLKTELVRKLQRLGDASPEMSRSINEQIVSLEQARRALRH